MKKLNICKYTRNKRTKIIVNTSKENSVSDYNTKYFLICDRLLNTEHVLNTRNNFIKCVVKSRHFFGSMKDSPQSRSIKTSCHSDNRAGET